MFYKSFSKGIYLISILVSAESLYFETGWSKLENSRKSRKLNLFDKIENNIAPTYLSDCLPTTIGGTVTYNLRYHEYNSHPTVHNHTLI
jgi:hypothetical protein